MKRYIVLLCTLLTFLGGTAAFAQDDARNHGGLLRGTNVGQLRLPKLNWLVATSAC